MQIVKSNSIPLMSLACKLWNVIVTRVLKQASPLWNLIVMGGSEQASPLWNLIVMGGSEQASPANRIFLSIIEAKGR
jgi:hypothetical protein